MKNLFAELRRYPSAIAGIMVIAALIGLSIYTVISIPYSRRMLSLRG
jgi:peptide/nickel transport system permease protein